MLHLRRQTLVILILALAAFSLPCLAGSYHARLDQPLTISGQVFEGSVVELSPIAQGNTHAVLVDGKTVALVFRHAVDRCPADARDAGFLFRTDKSGDLHLVGIRWNDGDSGRVEERPFRFATVARGIATVSASGTLAREGSLSTSR